MIGNAVPIRFSRRIKGNTRNLPFRVSPKRKIRKLTVKKRASGVNSSLLKAKVKVGKKNKLEETSNQASKILKRVSHNFKPVICESPRLSISKVYNKKGKTRNSFQTSLVYSKKNKISLKNLELADNSKKVIEKKNCKKFVNDEKQSVRKSLRLSKPLLNEKGKIKEHVSELKPSKEKPSQRKCTRQVTTLSSGPVLTPNLKTCAHIPKLSGRKKSARLSIEPQNQEMSVHMLASNSLALTPVPRKVTRTSIHSGNRKSARLSKKPQNLEIFLNTPASKLLAVTPVPGKVTRMSGHSGNRKSGRLLKEPIKSRIMDSETSLNMSSFFSLLETPQPEKHPEKRKSPRSLKPSPLRTLNKELPLSTPAYLLTGNTDSTLSKSSKSYKSAENLLTESSSRKRSKSKGFTKDGSTVSHEKRRQKQQVNQCQKTSENFKKPLSNETENLPLDSLTTPAFKPPRGRSLPKTNLSKSDSKNSKRKLNVSASENQIVREELQDAKKRKSVGGNYCVDNSTIPSKYRSMKKSVSPAKTNHTNKQIKYRNFESYLTPVVNIQGKMDILTADLFEKKSRRKVRSVPFENEINCVSYFSKGNSKNINSNEKKVKCTPCGNEILSPVCERKGKSTDLKMKPVRRLVPHRISSNLNSALSIKTISHKTIKQCLAKKPDNLETPQVSSPPIKMDCLTADLYKFKHRRTKSDNIELLCKRKTSALSKKWIRPLSPMRLTSNVNLKTESNLPNSKLGTLFPLPIDDLTAYESASCSPNGDRLVSMLSPCFISKKKTQSWPLGNELSSEISEISTKDDFPKIPAKGTLKRKRWLLNNLKEKNGSYEDDIFENKNFDLYKQAFHFGDESDGSSVNIATPKFDCILTPALPKKTPRYKDCYSPTEFLQARKTAEEYLHRRNKKRRSGNKPSSSGKKSNANKKKTIEEVPEKKKLDFEEAVNKLIEVQKNLEIEAEVDDEEEDSYFSDASN